MSRRHVLPTKRWQTCVPTLLSFNRPHPHRMSHRYAGSCLCGGVRFTLLGPLAPIQVCHCSQCRQAQGGPVATNVPVNEAAVTFEQGLDLLQRYESSPGKVRAFCRVCGSPVFSQRDTVPGVLRIRAGLLTEPVDVLLAFHAYVASKAGWWPIGDGAPQYPEAAPSPPGAAP